MVAGNSSGDPERDLGGVTKDISIGNIFWPCNERDKLFLEVLEAFLHNWVKIRDSVL